MKGLWVEMILIIVPFYTYSYKSKECLYEANIDDFFSIPRTIDRNEKGIEYPTIYCKKYDKSGEIPWSILGKTDRSTTNGETERPSKHENGRCNSEKDGFPILFHDDHRLYSFK